MLGRTKAIVVNRRRVSSDDVLVKLFTRSYGLLKFYVYGGRHPKSRLAASTQLFSEGVFDVYLKSSLSSIQSAEITDVHKAIVDDYEKFIYGSFFLELVDALSPTGESEPKLFDFLSAALKAFEVEEAANYKKFQCFFMLKLLKRLGYAPVVGRCSSCSARGDYNHFNHKSGGTVCNTCLALNPHSFRLSEDEFLFIKYSLEKPYALLPIFNNNATMFLNLEGLIFDFIYNNVSQIQLKSLELLKNL